MSTWIIDGEDGSKEVDTAKDDLTDEQLAAYYEPGDQEAGARLRARQHNSRYIWQPGDLTITPAPTRKECGGMKEVPYKGPLRSIPNTGDNEAPPSRIAKGRIN